MARPARYPRVPCRTGLRLGAAWATVLRLILTAVAPALGTPDTFQARLGKLRTRCAAPTCTNRPWVGSEPVRGPTAEIIKQLLVKADGLDLLTAAVARFARADEITQGGIAARRHAAVEVGPNSTVVSPDDRNACGSISRAAVPRWDSTKAFVETSHALQRDDTMAALLGMSSHSGRERVQAGDTVSGRGCRQLAPSTQPGSSAARARMPARLKEHASHFFQGICLTTRSQN